MQKVKPPQGFTPKEKRAFNGIVQRLLVLGIDPAERASLVADYVRADARLEELRKAEATGRGKSRLAASRALNVALAERRRLHAQIFGRTPDAEPPPTPAEAVQIELRSAADAAWRRHYATMRGRSRAEIAADEQALEAQYGEPSWNALLYGSLEEQREAEAKIATSLDRSRGGRPKRRRAAER